MAKCCVSQFRLPTWVVAMSCNEGLSFLCFGILAIVKKVYGGRLGTCTTCAKRVFSQQKKQKKVRVLILLVLRRLCGASNQGGKPMGAEMPYRPHTPWMPTRRFGLPEQRHCFRKSAHPETSRVAHMGASGTVSETRVSETGVSEPGLAPINWPGFLARVGGVR